MSKILIFGDAHLEQREEVDPSYLTMRNVIAREKFDSIYLLGDILDLSYISQWSKDLPGLTEGKRLKADLDLLEAELKYMKKYTREIRYFEGNHEYRLRKYILANPVLEGLVSIEEVCSRLKIEYILTEKQPIKIFPDLAAAHGLALNKYCSHANVTSVGTSIITGHSHRSQTFTTSYLDGCPHTGYSLGCISSLNPDYVAGRKITAHSQSFCILTGDKDMWDIQTYMLKGSRCIVSGKLYSPFKN